MINRIQLYRDDSLDREVTIEEASEVIEGQLLPGKTTYYVHDVVGVPTPQGIAPLQLRVPLPATVTSVHGAFAAMQDPRYAEARDAEAKRVVQKLQDAQRRQMLGAVR